MSENISAVVPDELGEKIRKHKEEYGFRTESKAIRDLVERGVENKKVLEQLNQINDELETDGDDPMEDPCAVCGEPPEATDDGVLRMVLVADNSREWAHEDCARQEGITE